MAPHTINRAALVVIAPALVISVLLALTVILAPVGFPLVALTVYAIVLAVQGGVRSDGPAAVRAGLPWILGGITAVLVTGMGLLIAFGVNDLDEPEEVVFASLFAVWTVLALVVTLQARTAAAHGPDRSPLHPPVPSGA